MNKGIAESGVLAALVMIIATVGSTGLLFGGGNLAGTGVITTVTALTAYSQMPHVKMDFRARKANEMCGYDCASEMTDDEILDYIRDDDFGIPNRVALMEANPEWRLGG